MCYCLTENTTLSAVTYHTLKWKILNNMLRTRSSNKEPNTQKDIRKPCTPSKNATYVLPIKIPGITKGLIVTPANSSTAQIEQIDSINDKSLLKHNIKDLYYKVLNNFY